MAIALLCQLLHNVRFQSYCGDFRAGNQPWGRSRNWTLSGRERRRWMNESFDFNDELLHDLLARTSRTFGLAIPLLPFPAQRDVTIAYLLFRIADTIEDGEFLSCQEKLAAFDKFTNLLESSADSGDDGLVFQSQLVKQQPCENEGYLHLLAHLHMVMQSAQHLDEAARIIVFDSLRKSVAGMRRFVERSGGDSVELNHLDELREYCYSVAGLVGELLTEIFLVRAPWLREVQDEIRPKSRWFGEGLQLVNILKDSQDDAQAGRLYIPKGVPRSELFDLARNNLETATEYVKLLHNAEAPSGFIAFVTLPLELAWQTLDQVQTLGPGSKVSRADVAEILERTIHQSQAKVPPGAGG